MINKIAEEIVNQLKSLDLFRMVELNITAKALQAPPSVAVFLVYDKKVKNEPTVTRELAWDLALLVPALGVGKGQDLAGTCIDAVRDAFVNWRPFTTGGLLPADVPGIRLEGIEKTVLVYTVRVTMQVMPAIIDKQG
jgi:hypothetical protein